MAGTLFHEPYINTLDVHFKRPIGFMDSCFQFLSRLTLYIPVRFSS